MSPLEWNGVYINNFKLKNPNIGIGSVSVLLKFNISIGSNFGIGTSLVMSVIILLLQQFTCKDMYKLSTLFESLPNAK